MADYKGIIKFIGENKDFALVEETRLYQNNITTSTGIGTGDGVERTFSGTLTPIVEEGELVVNVASVQKNASDSAGVITGTDITTSTGYSSTIDYGTGAISITFTSTGMPGIDEAVVIVYQYSSPSEFPEGLKFIKGNFNNLSVDDVIGYDYDADASEKDGYFITETYTEA